MLSDQELVNLYREGKTGTSLNPAHVAALRRIYDAGRDVEPVSAWVVDKEANMGYLTIQPGEVDHTVDNHNGILLDVDAEGTVLGVEVFL